MCLLVVMVGCDPEFPIVVAGNRDERTDRKSAPPGLFVGTRQRMLSPRDREKGGTWLAVSRPGLFAGITNVAGEPVDPAARTRGDLPHLALDADSLAGAVAAVEAEVAQVRFNAFQLVLADATQVRVLRHVAGTLTATVLQQPLVVVTNEHAPGALALAPFAPAAERGLSVAQRFARLLPLLRDEGALTGHRVLKKGPAYGTVSSSLIAVPARDPNKLIWEYAAGAPDTVTFKSYGNLGRRLLED